MTRGDRIRQVVAEYRERLEEILGPRLDSVVLYGSQARGEAEDQSDIDFLVVMNDPFDYGDLLQRTSEATAELSLAYDVVLSRTFVTRADFESKKSPFLMNVWSDGVRL